jgi:hypothetical protein
LLFALSTAAIYLRSIVCSNHLNHLLFSKLIIDNRLTNDSVVNTPVLLNVFSTLAINCSSHESIIAAIISDSLITKSNRSILVSLYILGVRYSRRTQLTSFIFHRVKSFNALPASFKLTLFFQFCLIVLYKYSTHCFALFILFKIHSLPAQVTVLLA